MILAKARMRIRHRDSHRRRTYRDDLSTSMSERSSSGDEEEVETMEPIMRGMGCCRRTSLLYDAIKHGARERVQRLLEAGADVNEMGENSNMVRCSEPPLVTAVRYENYHLVPLLLNRQADVNQPNGRGHTALIRACQKGNSDIISLLLHHGADPNMLDNARLSALYWAVKLDVPASVSLLLEYGATVNLCLQHGTTALHVAAMQSPELVRLLLAHTDDPDPVDDFSETPLFGALRADQLESCQVLLAAGADLNVTNSDTRCPLHIAAASVQQSVALVEMLLSHGAVINITDRYGHTPLVLSLRDSFFTHRNALRVPEVLIRNGASLNDDICARTFGWSTLSHGTFALARLAVTAGMRVRGVDWMDDLLRGGSHWRRWFTGSEVNADEEREFVAFLLSHLQQPPSLSHACRLRVRAHMRHTRPLTSIYYALQALPLPLQIIKYLQLEL